MWNSLPEDVATASNLAQFIHRLSIFLGPVLQEFD